MSVITRAIKSSLDASTDALKAAEEALAAAKIANVHARAAYDAFCASGYIPPFAIKDNKKKEEKCTNCKYKLVSCLQGKPLTETLIKDLVGVRVMSSGDSWKDKQKNMIGTIQSVKKATGNSFLRVLWDSKNISEQFTFTSKGSSKFIVYCKAQKPINPPSFSTACDSLGSSDVHENVDQCRNCKRKKCVHGKFLTTFNSSNIGLSVKHIEFHTEKVGKIADFEKGMVGIQWVGTNKVKHYMFLRTNDDDKAEFLFKYHCRNDAYQKDETKGKGTVTKPTDESTEEFFDAERSISLEEEETEFIMLSSPSAEIIDVEKEEEQKNMDMSTSTVDLHKEDDYQENIVLAEVEESGTNGAGQPSVQCSSCHSSVCQNGKYLLMYQESVIGTTVSYTGPDKEYFGCIGTILAHSKGNFLIKWHNTPEIVKIPLIKQHANEQQVYLQFKFLCDPNNKDQDENRKEIHSFDLKDEFESLSDETYNENEKCHNCNTYPCRDGQYLKCFSEVIQGISVKYSGTTRKSQIGVVGTISKVRDAGFFFVDKFKSYRQFLITHLNDSNVGELQFCYSCHTSQSKDSESDGGEDVEEGNQNCDQQQTVYSFNRLKIMLPTSILHKETGEKHRIIFKVDSDISFHGVGLNLKSKPTKVIITLIIGSDNGHGQWNRTLRNAVFQNVFVETNSLQFPEPIKLSRQESYLLLLSFYGGESYLFGDGMETVTAVIDSRNKVMFSFETFKDDQVTNVSQGVVNKLFFRLL